MNRSAEGAERKPPHYSLPFPQEPTLYDLLEVRRDASPEEIEQAYARAKARLSDISPQTRDLQTRGLQVEQAYRTLSDPQLRKAYETRDRPPEESREGHSGLPILATSPPSALASAEADGHELPEGFKYRLTLRKAVRTQEGLEIQLAPSALSHAASAAELRKHVPARFLRFNAERNSWTVASPYEEVIRRLSYNLSETLGEGPASAPTEFRLPTFAAEQRPDIAREPVRRFAAAARPSRRRAAWSEALSFSTLGIVGIVLLIGWQLYVSNSQRRQDLVLPVATLAPTRTPRPTATLPPTPVPTPVTFVTTTRYPRVHLRAAPTTNAASLGYLLAEEEFTVVGRTANGEWVRVEAGANSGWSAAWTLYVQDRLAELSVMGP